MGEATVTFKRLTDLYTLAGARQEFESGCTQLLQRMYPGKAHNAEVSQGDDGIDVFVGDFGKSIAVYQCKYFYDNMNSSRWSQIKHSFERAITSNKFRVHKWALCVSLNFTVKDHADWDAWKKEQLQKHPGLCIELWDGPQLITLMQQQKMYESFFHLDDARRIKEIHNYFYGNIEEERDLLADAKKKETPLALLVQAYFNGKYDDAHTAFEQAIKSDNAETVSTSQYWMGMVEKNIKNDWDAAKSHFETCCASEISIHQNTQAENSDSSESDSSASSSSNQLGKPKYTICARAYYELGLQERLSVQQQNGPVDNKNLEKARDRNEPRACFLYVQDCWEDYYKRCKDEKSSDPNDWDKKDADPLELAVKYRLIREYLNTVSKAENCGDRGDAYYYLSKLDEVDEQEATESGNRTASIKNKNSDKSHKTAPGENSNNETGNSSAKDIAESDKSSNWNNALKYGSTLAYKENANKSNPLQPKLVKTLTNDPGVCIINEVNTTTEWLCRSIPANWDIYSTAHPTDRDSMIGCQPISHLIYSQVGGDSPVYYMLFSDDYHKNLRDAVELLENHRNMQSKNISKKIEIFLLCIVSQAAPVIDTLLNSMDDPLVPVHLVDKHRLAAQMLFGRYPLFYPLWKKEILKETSEKHPSEKSSSKNAATNAQNDSSQSNSHPLCLVIIGSGDNALWLVREATALMSFPEEDHVISSIAVVAPDADQLQKRFYYLCPGLTDEMRKEIGRWLPLPEYHFVKARIEDEITSAYIRHRADYVVICGDNDTENLERAIYVRQLLIRSHPANPDRLPPVAYECADAYLSYLGKRTVVENEKFGHNWTNSYQLIPFGTGELFTWDHLVEGYENKMAKCTHLRYCSAKWDVDHDYHKNLRSYYEREYNRDSSFSVAISFPYRLWAVAKLKNAKQLFFTDWDFDDSASFFSADRAKQVGEQLKELADKYGAKDNNKQSILLSEPEQEEIAIWEHNRWCRWMLSRGYLPMTTTQMINYINFGNHRQSLAVGKLHALICPYKDIENVEKALSIARNINQAPGYLRNLDIDHVQDSWKIWTADWLDRNEPENAQ